MNLLAAVSLMNFDLSRKSTRSQKKERRTGQKKGNPVHIRHS
jgi:hypothetical protein